ncbi:LCP family protein [Paenibacillus sp. TRM 82003]|uniref:LCP family protein n=1 Tax=Kineococcus sp. TRM81007 TaxID=2925831 RepID=UPI001F5A6A5D|nr:LCP family protein [Kineococcus sp. TRM81007]MCI2240566.1 LCP family protein [Kineococcus sp. TRM81007]MCI3918945.1 LCP family protein [Paenibacillus sp. TRM 82003]
MPTTDGSVPPRADVPGAGRRARGQHASHAHTAALRALRVAVVALVALALTAGAGGVYAYQRLQGNITAEDVSGLLGTRPGKDEDTTAGTSPVNILVMGSDTRALADGTGGAYGGEAADPGARSDTTVLVHLAGDRESATLVSIPRDSMVEIPACTAPDGSTIEAHVGMFNSAFTEGGPACTITTVEALTGVYVDHYAVVDFSGFRSMIDALGGVTICTPEDIDDRRANLHLEAGTHEDVDGETALAYARVRYIGDGSDLSRIERQQALMSSIVQEVTSSQILLRPDRLYSFLDAATKSVTTDPDLASISELVDLAQSVQGMPADAVRFVTVPTEPYPPNDARVQWTAAAEELWQRIRTDTAGQPSAAPTATASTDPSASSQLVVAPGDVSVRVVNTGAPAGTAAAVADALAEVGFAVAGVGDGEASDSSVPVLVRYGPDRADSAQTVAAAFGGAAARPDGSLGRTVVVEVSSADHSVTDVRARVTGATAPPSATAGAAASPEPTITARVATDDICA